MWELVNSLQEHPLLPLREPGTELCSSGLCSRHFGHQHQISDLKIYNKNGQPSLVSHACHSSCSECCREKFQRKTCLSYKESSRIAWESTEILSLNEKCKEGWRLGSDRHLPLVCEVLCSIPRTRKGKDRGGGRGGSTCKALLWIKVFSLNLVSLCLFVMQRGVIHLDFKLTYTASEQRYIENNEIQDDISSSSWGEHKKACIILQASHLGEGTEAKAICQWLPVTHLRESGFLKCFNGFSPHTPAANSQTRMPGASVAI